MPDSPQPPAQDEQRRLAGLRALNLLDSPHDPVFDHLAATAATLCGTPMAAISLIDEQRQWFKASVGLDGLVETPREIAFCDHTIRQDGLFEIADARTDQRFADNPLVTAEAGVRFYAGVPLRLPDGSRIGALAVIDCRPRALEAAQRAGLEQLGQLATELVLQHERAHLLSISASITSIVQQSDDAVIGLARDGIITSWNSGAERLFGYHPAEALGQPFARLVPDDELPAHLSALAQVLRRQSVPRSDRMRRHRDGRLVDVSVTMAPILDDRERVIGAVAILRDVTQRRRAQEALRDSEARYRSLVETQADLVSMATPDGLLTFVNAAYAQHFGRLPEQMVGTSLYDWIPATERDAVRGYLQALCRRGGWAEGENRMLSEGREPRWVLWRNQVVTDPAGHTIALHSFGRDITERKRLELELARARADLQAIMDHSPVMISSWSADGHNRFSNRSYAQWYGTTSEALLGRHVSTILPADAYERSAPYLQRATDGEPQSFERAATSADGSTRYSLVDCVPAADPAGQSGPYVFVTDITRRVLAEQRAEANSARYQGLYERTPVMMHSIDRDGVLLSVSDTWLHKLGYARAEVIGRRSTEFLSAESRTRALQQVIPEFFRTGRIDEVEYQMVRKDGSVIDVLMSAVAETDAAGGFLRTMAVIQDVTARKQAEARLRASEALLDRAGRVAHVGAWEFDLRTQEIRWSDETCRIHEVPPGHQPGLEEALAFYTPDARATLAAAVETCMREHLPYDLELPLVTRQGREIWVRTAGEAEVREGEVVRLFGAFQDVTERRLAAQQLAEQHELMRVTLESIGDAVITTDATGCISWLNPVAERMTGWLAAEARGRALEQVFRVVHAETRRPAANPIGRCLALGQAVALDADTVLISREGIEFGIEDSAAPIRAADGQVVGAVMVFHDVSEQRRLAGEMHWRATHDQLTGLINRSEFDHRLDQAFARARSEGRCHALIYIDLDQFKLVNDACGHAVGDELLRRVARLLGDAVRARDSLARLGGDEFAAILEYCTVEQATRVATKICEQMEDFRFLHDERRFRIGASIGLVPVDARWNSASAILQAADASCYAAKEAGRNRVHVWFDTDSAMRARHGETQWATRIEHALQEDGFRLYAQVLAPVSGPAGGRRAEVLLRMLDADGSIIAPGQFLPAAERFHLATRIDRWVVRQVLAFLATLEADSDIDTICVNLSGQSIGDRSFHQRVLDLLTDVPPDVRRRLCFEITETAAVTNLADAGAFIAAMRSLGVRMALDDFGAGASSFGYLKSLQVDCIKIDGQFIRDLLDDPLDDVAVRCFVEVARVLGIRTVAEFVESRAILERLRELGVDFAQGYAIGRPAPLAEVLGTLTRPA